MSTEQRRALAATIPTTEVIKDAVTFPRDRLGEPLSISDERFEAWLRSVRRDAADEAWTDCVSEASALGWLHPSAALDMLDRNPHEETP